MNIPESALAALGVLLCIGIILAVKEYIALRRVLSQQPVVDVPPVVPVSTPTSKAVRLPQQIQRGELATHGYLLAAASTGWYCIEDLKKEDITKRNLEELLGLKGTGK